VMIAGDVYDKSNPTGEAVKMFGDFLSKLAARNLKVFVISGNHDMAERIAYAGDVFKACNVFMSPVYDGKVEPITFSDENGEVNFYLMPFVRPSSVRAFFPDKEIASYTDAMRVAIEAMQVDGSKRNVLITHQFVTGATRSDSEDFTVGGTDNVDASVFDVFDYVALGHIHGPQDIGSKKIRYCGTPLKYSFSEVEQEKSVTVVELGAKGDLTVNAIPLKPLHNMAKIRGFYNELLLEKYYEGTTLPNDYVHITLLDEDDVPDAAVKLRTVYKNLMKLEYDNKRTQAAASRLEGAVDVETKTPYQLFQEFFTEQNNQDMNEEQAEFMKQLFEKEEDK